MVAPGAQGSQAIFGSQKAFFGAVFLDHIKRVSALQASLTIKVNPQQVNPLKSLHIEETMVRLSITLLQRASPQPFLNCLGLRSHLTYLKMDIARFNETVETASEKSIDSG